MRNNTELTRFEFMTETGAIAIILTPADISDDTLEKLKLYLESLKKPISIYDDGGLGMEAE